MADVENEQDLLWVHNPTKAPFTVSWGGFPYTLQSGEKKVMPRFVAQHYAKHLTDAILLRKEEQEYEKTKKRPNYVRHPVERPKIVRLILLGIYSYHQPTVEDAGAIVNNVINQANAAADPSKAPAAPQEEVDYEDFGLIPNTAIGELAPPPDPDDESAVDSPVPPAANANQAAAGELLEEAPAPPPVGLVGDAADPTAGQPPKLDRAKLLEEAEALGIEGYKKMSTEALDKAIRNF